MMKKTLEIIWNSSRRTWVSNEIKNWTKKNAISSMVRNDEIPFTSWTFCGCYSYAGDVVIWYTYKRLANKIQ